MTLSELFMFSKVRFENPKVHAIIFPSNSIIFCTKQQKYKPYTLETDTDYALGIDVFSAPNIKSHNFDTKFRQAT